MDSIKWYFEIDLEIDENKMLLLFVWYNVFA